MNFHMDGNLKINAGIESTFKNLCDPAFMSSCVPDLVSSEVVDKDHFNAKVKVGIAIVRGTVQMKFALIEKREPTHAKLIADGSGAGSKMHIESIFDLKQEGNATNMSWSADTNLSGLMAGIGGPILKGQSEKMVSRIFDNIRSKLES
jgi:uncharacterized protein